MKVVHEWALKLPTKTGRVTTCFRLLRDERDLNRFAIERCEMDLAGKERWVFVSEWDQELVIKNAVDSGNYPITALLTIALLGVLGALASAGKACRPEPPAPNFRLLPPETCVW